MQLLRSIAAFISFISHWCNATNIHFHCAVKAENYNPIWSKRNFRDHIRDFSILQFSIFWGRSIWKIMEDWGCGTFPQWCLSINDLFTKKFWYYTQSGRYMPSRKYKLRACSALDFAPLCPEISSAPTVSNFKMFFTDIFLFWWDENMNHKWNTNSYWRSSMSTTH